MVVVPNLVIGNAWKGFIQILYFWGNSVPEYGGSKKCKNMQKNMNNKHSSKTKVPLKTQDPLPSGKIAEIRH